MRGAGILLHISSLPSRYGIGTFGKEAYRFVDFLKEAGQRYWQILPLGPTSYGDSPYQSFSSYAGNPYFIDLDLLCEDGLLKRSELKDLVYEKGRVDYGKIYLERRKILYQAYKRFDKKDEGYQTFVDKERYWLEDYALFMTIKELEEMRPWQKWPKALKERNVEALDLIKKKHADMIDHHKVLQYLFYKEWSKLKGYANEKGIKIIGDLPIYVAMDSVEVWAYHENFLLDEDLMPRYVAGVPGDAFDSKGQLWGNPLYDQEYQAKTNYKFYIDRLVYQNKLYDVIRLDHFRGFKEYYAVPYDAKDASTGFWLKGPGIKLFRTLKEHYGDLEIIAEDLGVITDDVRELLRDCKFPGMKVLEFAFDHGSMDSEYLPHNMIRDCVAYIGTHDNAPIEGWLKDLSKEDRRYLYDYLNIKKKEDARSTLIKALYSSVADTVIIQAQDLLGLDERARMNTPGKASGNWSWRLEKPLGKALAHKLKKEMILYGR